MWGRSGKHCTSTRAISVVASALRRRRPRVFRHPPKGAGPAAACEKELVSAFVLLAFSSYLVLHDGHILVESWCCPTIFGPAVTYAVICEPKLHVNSHARFSRTSGGYHLATLQPNTHMRRSRMHQRGSFCPATTLSAMRWL